MNIKNKKGYALIMAIIFIIILAISSIALYNSVTHVGRDLKIKEKRYVKGYYAAIAGLRYASILLRNPAALTFNGNNVCTVSQDQSYNAFFTNINVEPGDPANLAVGEMGLKIEKLSETEYKVTSNYSY